MLIYDLVMGFWNALGWRLAVSTTYGMGEHRTTTLQCQLAAVLTLLCKDRPLCSFFSVTRFHNLRFKLKIAAIGYG